MVLGRRVVIAVRDRAALMGVVIIIWMYSPSKRYRHAGAPTSIPYRGWKRWHAITGLFFGVVTATWAFSGLLSMGPVSHHGSPDRPDRAGSGRREPRWRRWTRKRADFGEFVTWRPRNAVVCVRRQAAGDAIAAVQDFDAKELESTAFAGEPLYLLTNGRGETRLIPLHGDPMTTLDPEDVLRVVRTPSDRISPTCASLRNTMRTTWIGGESVRCRSSTPA